VWQDNAAANADVEGKVGCVAIGCAIASMSSLNTRCVVLRICRRWDDSLFESPLPFVVTEARRLFREGIISQSEYVGHEKIWRLRCSFSN